MPEDVRQRLGYISDEHHGRHPPSSIPHALALPRYFTRNRGYENIGQAASHTGAEVGKKLEEQGKGLQYKK